MQAKPEYRNRDDTEVAVLDALADRNGDGMTVFEIRAKVDVDIDTLEEVLAELKDDQLIEVSKESGQTLIQVEQHVIGPDNPHDTSDFLSEIRRRFPF